MMTTPSPSLKRSPRRLFLLLGIGAAALICTGFVIGPDLWRAWRFQSAIETEAHNRARFGASARALAQTCGLCHGLDGNSKSDLYPQLAGQPSGYIEAQLNAFASGARRAPQMQPLAISLTPEDRRSIGAYYSAFAALPKNGTRAANKRYAEPSAAAAACAACHGVGLRGGISPVLAPRLAGQGKVYLARQLRAFRSGERTDPAGLMSVVTRSLTDAQIDRLAQNVSDMRP